MVYTGLRGPGSTGPALPGGGTWLPVWTGHELQGSPRCPPLLGPSQGPALPGEHITCLDVDALASPGFPPQARYSWHPRFSNTPCWAVSLSTSGWRGETRPNFLHCLLIPALQGELGAPGPVSPPRDRPLPPQAQPLTRESGGGGGLVTYL